MTMATPPAHAPRGMTRYRRRKQGEQRRKQHVRRAVLVL